MQWDSNRLKRSFGLTWIAVVGAVLHFVAACSTNANLTSPTSALILTPQAYPLSTPIASVLSTSYPSPQPARQMEFVLTVPSRSTQTPSPTFPVEARPCRGSDLVGALHGEGATGSIVFVLILTNSGDEICYLQGPPNVIFVDADGNKIDVHYYSECFLCKEANAQEMLNAKIGIGVNEKVGVFMTWSNWCKPPVEKASIRLVLSNDLGHVDVSIGALTGARCDAPEADSFLMMSHYSHTND